MKLQKTISLILAPALLFSMIPLQAAAAELGGSAAEVGAKIPEVRSESSVGAVLGAAIEQNEQHEITSEGITDVAIDGRTATVTLLHTKPCMVVIGIYDETGETLLQTAQQRGIAADEETAVLTFDGDLPAFFYLRAYILDESCAPLGKAFETDRYTSAYKEFLDKTTADFPAENVINFDDSATDNFAVFDSAVKEISTDGKNIPTIGENSYTFTDADESLLALAEGDIFTYDNNGEPEIVKIGSVSVSGDEVTITPAEAQMDEVFDYVKIDVTTDEASLDMSAADEGVSCAPQDDGSVGAGTEYKLLRHFNFNIERNNIEGELDMTAAMRFKLYYSDGILETELTDEVSGELDVSVGVKYEGAFRLCKLRFPTPVAGLMIAVEVEFTPEVSAKFNGKVEFSQKVGCAYSSKTGFCNLSQKPELDAEVNFEGTIFIGFKLTPSVEALFGVVELGLECKLGAEGTGTRVLTTTDTKESDHLCRRCVDGTISVKVEIAAEIETGFWKTWKHTLSVKLLDWEKELFDFYVSSDKGFGKGVCMNRSDPVEQPDIPEYKQMDIEYSEDNYSASYSVSDDRLHIDVHIRGSGNVRSNDAFGIIDFVDQYNNEMYEKAETLYPYDWDKANQYYCEHKILYGYTVSYYVTGFNAVSVGYGIYSYDRNTDVHISGPTKVVIWGGCHSIDLPDSVEELYVHSTGAASVRLPKNVKYVGGFDFCEALTELTIPSSAEYVDGFSNCPIRRLTIMPPENGLTLKGFWKAPIENLVIPQGVRLYYFQPAASAMKNVTVQADTTRLLQFCKESEEVRFADPLTRVGKECCNNCHNLKKVRFDPSVTSIGSGAFSYSGLESVTIPGTVKKIGEQAFAECENLREIIIEDGVKEIDSQAFTRCHHLERVVLPASLSYLSKDAFDDCDQGVELDFCGEPWQWWNLTAEYRLSENNVLVARRMSDVEYDASVFMNCIIFLNSDGTKQLRSEIGNDPVGIGTANGYANAEYLIAVEDAENGRLNGQITALYQVSADKNGNITIPDHIAADVGEYLNLYGACRHPSAHLSEDNRNLCDVCGARLPAIIDCGKQPEAPDISVGDVNLDCKIDIIDVTLIQKHIAELVALEGKALTAADTNGDSVVDIDDATLLQKYIAEYDVVLGRQPA